MGRPKRVKALATTIEDVPVGMEKLTVWHDPGRRIAPERINAFIEFVFDGGPNPRNTGPRQLLLVDSRRPKHLRPPHADNLA